ncbi:MAG: Ig-like domain-containing protein [Gammaproteobacteria bacterium]|nr:Ig-like domain-containing protein [Gammaproteobacteria bacterium]
MAETVEISPASVTFEEIGDTLQLTAEVKDGDGNVMTGVEITWSTDMPDVATVNADGLITSAGPGTATITATAGELTATAGVTVIRRPDPEPTESAADRAALVAFYESAGGDNWVNRANWLSDAPIAEWHGVWVDPNSGRVVALYLAGNGLEGSISPELAKLTMLAELSLSLNNLSGSLPPELGELANLETLLAGANNLSGAIPHELGNIASLVELGLTQNKLSGPIPPELANLTNLVRLELTANRLSGGIPPAFGNLSQLEKLSLGGNRLSGPIPPELGRLDRLNILSMWINELSGPLPPELGNLTSLERLDVIDNRLSGTIPVELTRVPLKDFFWVGNPELCQPDTSAFAEWLESISQLRAGAYCNRSDRSVLEALYDAAGGSGWTNASGWPDGSVDARDGIETDSVGRVVAINLSENGLSGTLPLALGDLALLEELQLDGNPDLSGRLPYTLPRIEMLRQFRYDGTDLCVPRETFLREWLDEVPEHEGTGLDCAPSADRDVLESIYESMRGEEWRNSDNWLSDAPLREWHGVQTDGQGRVVSLSLTFNSLKGPIPADIALFEELTSLELGGNDTNNSRLPPDIGELKKLEILDLAGIFASGPIPPRIEKLTRLKILNLAENKLTGSIPSEIGNLTSLVELHLDNNRLTGSIPGQLADAAGLEQIHLPNNDLSGALPDSLAKLGKLRLLDVSGNSISGNIPASFGEFAQLSYLNLSYNNLGGGIPAELAKGSSLKQLYLGSNSLSGPVPPELADLAQLNSLALTGNADLSGPLPAEFVNLREMTHLQAADTGLCAPQDTRLLGWLNGLLTRRIRQCGVQPVAAYLTQAIQSHELPIALVAGEEALLRVFPTAEQANSERIPRVRANFYLAGKLEHEIDIASSPGPIPTRLDESSLERSAYASVPAEVVQPGLEVVIEIDPEGTLDEGLGVTGRIPDTGRLAVEVRDMPTFDVTFVPFLWETNPDRSVVDLVNEMEADPMGHEMLEQTRRLLPVGDIAVTAHASVRTSSNEANHLISETQLIATMEGGEGYYMGLLSGEFSGASGIGNLGLKVAYSVTSADVIAHEFGHNLSLSHTPCGGPLGIEPAFPYPDGSSGAWGYDFGARRLVSPDEYVDLMSYCSPYWISDFSFDKALRYRLHDAGLLSQPQSQEPVDSLIVWGGRDTGSRLFLEPALVTRAPPAFPDSSGPYRIRGTAADGKVLFDLSFDMPIAGDGGGSSSFAFALPMQGGWPDAIDSIRLSGPQGRSATLNEDTDRPVTVLRDGPAGEVTAIIREPRAASALRNVAQPGLFSRGIPRTGAGTR